MRVVTLCMVEQRDWNIDQLITNELCKRGHKAVLRKYTQDGRIAVVVEKPDVCIVPVVRCEYTRDFVTRLKQWGVKVIARRSEAGVSKTQYNKLPRALQLDQIGRYEYKDLVDMELVWSQEFADILIAEGKIRPEQVRVIGGISTDIYFQNDIVEQMMGLRETKKEDFFKQQGFDLNKKLLLFCTGFVHADLNGYSLPEAPVGDPIHRYLQDRDIGYRKNWVWSITKLAETNKYNIMLRLHHGECVSKYNVPNSVVVSNEGNAADVLLNCDCLIHAGSTMAVEAHLLNKPAFNFGNTAQDELIRDVSPAVETTENLFNALDSMAWGKSNALIESVEDLKKHFYGEIDGNAHKRVVDAVCEFNIQSSVHTIPEKWPEDELKDYSSDGVVKVKDSAIINCPACKKPFQNLTKNKRVPCPHCGLAVDTDFGVCK